MMQEFTLDFNTKITSRYIKIAQYVLVFKFNLQYFVEEYSGLPVCRSTLFLRHFLEMVWSGNDATKVYVYHFCANNWHK